MYLTKYRIQFESLCLTSVKHHWSCHMDQPICGHLDNHRPVACCHHVHAPEDNIEVNQDRPKIRHVPGKCTEGAAARGHFSSPTKQCWALAKKCLCISCSWCWSWVSCRALSSTSSLWKEPSPVLLPFPPQPEDTVSSHSTGCSSPSLPVIILFFIYPPTSLMCVCLCSVESAAFDLGDVHHHAGHTAALSATLRTLTWGGTRR